MLDILKVTANSSHQYDLPFYFHGQLIDTNFAFEKPATLEPMGEGNGYQHLYLERKGSPSDGTAKVTWLKAGRFYSLTSVAEPTDELMFTRIGANDPDFNLRRDAAFMLRRPDAGSTTFVSAVESHGSYSPVSELTLNARSGIAQLKLAHDSRDYSAVAVEATSGAWTMLLVAADPSASKRHRLRIDGRTYRWRGPYHLVDSDSR